MSVGEIKEGIKSLSREERSEVSNFLSRLRLSEDPDYWTRIRRRVDDKNPDHWVSLDEVISGEG